MGMYSKKRLRPIAQDAFDELDGNFARLSEGRSVGELMNMMFAAGRAYGAGQVLLELDADDRDFDAHRMMGAANRLGNDIEKAARSTNPKPAKKHARAKKPTKKIRW